MAKQKYYYNKLINYNIYTLIIKFFFIHILYESIGNKNLLSNYSWDF